MAWKKMINWQNGKLHFWLRSTALVVVLVFTWNTIVWADGSGHVLLNLNKGSQEIPVHFANIQLPKELGQIKRAYQGTREEMVIHIQDAHVNEEAQRRIADIIDYFVKQHGARLVNVEGSAGELAHTLLSAYPDDKARELVGDYFLRESLFTGPEYLAVTRHPELTLFGVEEKDLYQANRKVFLDALAFKGRDEKVLSELRKTMQVAARHVFSDSLWHLIQTRHSFEKEEKDFVTYIKELEKLSDGAVKNYPQVSSFIKLIDDQEKIDWEKAEKEIEALTDQLKKNLKGQSLLAFLKKTEEFRTQKMTRAEYYEYLEPEF